MDASTPLLPDKYLGHILQYIYIVGVSMDEKQKRSMIHEETRLIALPWALNCSPPFSVTQSINGIGSWAHITTGFFGS
jgi:hypothetical protein